MVLRNVVCQKYNTLVDLYRHSSSEGVFFMTPRGHWGLGSSEPYMFYFPHVQYTCDKVLVCKFGTVRD